MSVSPWTFQQARQAAHEASARQQRAEQTLREASAALAEAERAYRRKLAETILTLRAEGTAATACGDIARGNNLVSDLRYKRDVAEGVLEAAKQAAWRLTADRKDVHQFAAWSLRRELAENGDHTPLEAVA